MKPRRSVAPLLRIALLTFAAVAIHGYHFGVDDASIYLPAVKQFIHPELYPFGTDFFLSHERLSRFAAVVGGTARVSHLSGDLVIFLWHVASIFVFLFAAWRLLDVLFESNRARWGSLLLVTTVLTVPVAGTALVIMDPYLTARSGSTPMTMLAVAAFLSGRRGMTLLWLVLTAAVHPQMAVYGIVFLGILSLPATWVRPLSGKTVLPAAIVSRALPTGFKFGPASPDYRPALYMRTFFFLQLWTWYEWTGILAPLALLTWFSRIHPRGATAEFSKVARAQVIFGGASLFVGLLFASSANFENFVRLQPLRAFHLIYVLFFLMIGGLLGEYVLKERRWLWVALFAAIGTGMFFVQKAAYPDSRHVEWPGVQPRNRWIAAFLWARADTPKNAVFALDPDYMALPGEDQHGFRAIAERSMLSDAIKDSGVVSLFPQLAGEWEREQRAQAGWKHFQLADFERLAREYPVSWAVIDGTVPAGLVCPYRKDAVSVCQIPGAPGLPASGLSQ